MNIVFDNEEKEFKLLTDKFLLTMVPKKIIKEYIANEEYRNEALRLWKKHKKADPLRFSKEKSFKHKFYLILRAINYSKKYAQNKNTI